jgi:cytochrome b
MATRAKRGWKAYVPTLQRVGQIFVALVAIKFVWGMVGPMVPASVSKYAPNV